MGELHKLTGIRTLTWSRTLLQAY